MEPIRRYLVLSDLHLADLEDHADGWKAHKHSRHRFDSPLDRVVNRFLAAAKPDTRSTLVLNGDIVDFDLVMAIPEPAPWPVSRREQRRGLAPTPQKSAWKLRRILADHPEFLSTVARTLAGGHDIIWVLGNHDGELFFPETQAVIREALPALQIGDAAPKPGKLRFEPWFYYVPGQVYIEHGHQYDRFSSQRRILDPVDKSRPQPRALLSMGNVSNRTLLGRMGTFNPHASDYILSTPGYFKHWLKHYAFNRRSLLLTWILGSIAVFFELVGIGNRERRRPPLKPEILAAEAEHQGLPVETLLAIDAERQAPVSQHPWRMARELWLDQVLLALLMVGGTIALALSPSPLWVALMVPLCAFPLSYLIYERLATGDSIFTMEHEAQHHARAIARLLPVRVVSFGHSHVPELLPLAPGVTYANSGTWAPVPGPDGAPKPGLRNALVIVCSAGRAEVRLESHQERASMPPLARLRAMTNSEAPKDTQSVSHQATG